MNPTESFIVTHFNEVVSLIIAAALGWAGKAFYATIQEQKALKKAVKDGMAEDEQKNSEAKLQKVHDKYIKQIDDLYAAKDKEIMTV